MTIVNERLKELRVNERYTQAQIAEMCGVTQVTVGRYETGMCEPPIDKLLWYAEKFDVSLDYIFGRTNNPKGILYQTIPSADASSSEIRRFVDMCFDPESPMSEKLKIFLVNMLEEKKNEQ